MKVKLFKFYNFCKILWAWIRKSPLNAVIAAIIFLAIVFGLVLFVKIVLPSLLVCVIVGYVFFGNTISAWLSAKTTPQQQTLENGGVCWSITTFAFGAVSSVSNAISEFIHAPYSANGIYDNSDYISVFNDAPLLKLRLLRKHSNTPPDCGYIKNVLQGAVDARLRDGHLYGYAWAVPAALDVPLVKVATVDFSDMYIHVGLLLSNTAESVYAARISDNPSPQVYADDTDPLFRGD